MVVKESNVRRGWRRGEAAGAACACAWAWEAVVAEGGSLDREMRKESCVSGLILTIARGEALGVLGSVPG
jgi:hypothetical protein